MLYPIGKNMLKTDSSNWVIGSLSAADGTNYSVSNAFRYEEFIPVKPNTTYTVSHSSKYKHYLHQYTISKGHAVSSFWQTAARSYTTGANTYFVRVIFRPMDDSLVTMANFADVLPQLEEGSTVSPYEPVKLGNKPAVLYPSINLLNPDPTKWKQGSADSSGNLTGGSTRLVLLDRVKMNPSTKYTVKVNNGYRVFMRNFSDQSVEISNSGWVTDGYTFTTPANIKTVLVLVARGDDGGINESEISKALPMLAQGEYSQNIPYKGVNKTAAVYAKKNILLPTKKATWKTWFNTGLVIDDLGDYSFTLTNARDGVYGVRDVIVPTTVGKTYTFSMDSTDAETYIWGFKSQDGVTYTDNTGNQVFNPAYNKKSFSFVATSPFLAIRFGRRNAGVSRFSNYQMEEGAIVTAFEPYKAINKPAVYSAKKNLFNLSELKETAWTVNALYKMYDLKPNTFYTLSTNCPMPDNGTANIYFNGNSTPSNGVYKGKSVTAWTSTSGKLYIAIPYNPDRQYTQDLLNGKYWVQLEEGSTATAFEPYKPINKPAVLYPQKNIVNHAATAWENGSISSNGNLFNSTTSLRSSDVIRVKPNGTYTLTVLNTASKIVVSFYNASKVFVSTPNTFYRDGKTFTVPADCPFMKLVLMNDDSTIPIVPSDVAVKNKIQIEEGSVATKFEPYILGNKPL